MTHKVLEIIGRAKKLKQDKQEVYIDDIIGKYSFKTRNKLPNDININQLCNDSFTYYSSSSKHEFTKGDLAKIKKWVFSVTNGEFDPRKLDIVDVERPFDFEIKKEWAKLPNGQYLRLKGTVDLIIKQSDKLYEVVDWKTGQRKNWGTGAEKTLEIIQKDPQLCIYYMALLHEYGSDKDYMATIHYIRDGGPFTITFDKSSLSHIISLLKDRYNDMSNCYYPELKGHGKHWFCTKICQYSKVMHESGMSICSYINKLIIIDGIDEVIKKETAIGHTIDKYQAPGEK
jgi:hypothetical protein